MVDSNMFDVSSIAAGDLRLVGHHDKQTFGEMLADAANSLSTDTVRNDPKHSATSSHDNLPHHLHASILTRDNHLTASFDQLGDNNHDSHQDMAQCVSSEGQNWYTPSAPMSISMTEGWSASDSSTHANLASFQQQQQIDMNLNYMYNNPSLLFQGCSSTTSGFINHATPSTNEPIWQRRMHARNQSQQTQEYDHVLLSMLAESQRSMDDIPAPPAYSNLNENNHNITERERPIKGASDGYPSFAHESSNSLSNTMSPVQMQWNHAASTYPELSSNHFHENYDLQRNSSGSHSASSGNLSSRTPESSLLNQNLSSIPTSLNASPIEPNSTKMGQWDTPIFDQSEESDGEESKRESRKDSVGEKGSKIRKREAKDQQNKISRQSKAAISPRNLSISLQSPNEEDSQEFKAKKKSSESSSNNIKGIISKVMVSKGAGIDGEVIETETAEGGETRHLCPQPGCDKHFSTSGHARRHSRIHASLRPFECPHEGCGATFTRRDNCTQHQRARHRCQLVAKRLSDERPQSASKASKVA